MTANTDAAVEAAATAMLTPQMRRILHAAGLELIEGQDALMAQFARLAVEAAAPHLVAVPDAAVEAAVLAERAACLQCCKDAQEAAEGTYGTREGVGAHMAEYRVRARSAAPLPTGSGT